MTTARRAASTSRRTPSASRGSAIELSRATSATSFLRRIATSFGHPTGLATEPDVATYSARDRFRVARAQEKGAFTLLLGGDCGIVLGALLGARRAARSRVGLVYVDAHADFATPESSRTGSAASMCLALAVGRGDTALARLSEDGPLVRSEDVVLIGRRDRRTRRGTARMHTAKSPVLDLTHERVRTSGAMEVACDARAVGA